MQVLSVKNWAHIKPETNQDREQLIRSLILNNTYNDAQIHLWKSGEDDSLYVPIEFLPFISVEEKAWKRYKFRLYGKLRSEQIPLYTSYIEHTNNHNGGIIKSPTGSGKTVIGLNIIARLGYKTLIIVPTDYLMGQWREQLKLFLQLKESEIGICRQSLCDYKNKKVVIGMIHSLAKQGRYPVEFYNEFGLVIVDEVHKLSAPTFSQSLPQFWSKYRLGLSATPRRKDGYENVFRYHIGDICNLTTNQTIKPNVVIIKYDNIASHHSGCVWGGQLSLGRYYNKLARIWHRNNMIANITVALAKKGKDVLVLSDRLLQLEALDSLLRQSGITDIGIFTGQKKKGLDRKILLATYGSAGLGADIPRLSAVVFATPRVDVEQPMGRVLREAKNEPQIVVDIIDTRSTIMQQWGYARMHFYRKNAGKITYKEVKAGD